MQQARLTGKYKAMNAGEVFVGSDEEIDLLVERKVAVSLKEVKELPHWSTYASQVPQQPRGAAPPPQGRQ